MKLTQNLFSLFKDRLIRIFDHKELIKELLSVKIVERSYGYRIDHEAGQHDDCAVSLGMAALACNVEPLPVSEGQVHWQPSISVVGDAPLDLETEKIRVWDQPFQRSPGGDWPWDL